MNQSDEISQGEPQANRVAVIFTWDDVFGLHLQVQGDLAEAQRVVECLAEANI